MDEIWKAIKDFEGFEVSNLGRVRKGSKIKKASPGKDGYCRVNLRGYSKSVHRLVCIAFHGDPPWEGANALHKDDVGSNNKADNLYWGDQVDNALDRSEHAKVGQRGELHHNAKLTQNDVDAIRGLYLTIPNYAEISRRFKITPQQVSAIIRYKSWT